MKPSIKAKSTRKEAVISALVRRNAKAVGKKFERGCSVRCLGCCTCRPEPIQEVR